jgi:YD repeat-containing protein
VEVTTPPRSDGMTVITTLEIQNNRLTTITDPVGQKVSLTYTDTGLLEGISTTGATTHITYQTLPDGAVAVDTVRVIDAVTGKELSTRTWNVIGEHTATGWPTYQGHAVLWASGDDLGFMWWLQHSDI